MTIDTTTGEVLTGAEVIPSTALARPTIAEPGSPITPELVAYQCRSVEVWAEHCDSIPEIRDTANKLDAIGRYVEATGTDGRAAIQATLRRLEVRIGQILGPATVGAHSSANEGADLTPNQRSDMRKMADHPDIVEDVIANSTDDSPASRRKAMDEINRAKHTEPPPLTPAQQRAKDEEEALKRRVKRLEKFLDGWDEFISLQSHPLRDEMIARLNDHDRTRLLDIEKDLFS